MLKLSSNVLSSNLISNSSLPTSVVLHWRCLNYTLLYYHFPLLVYLLGSEKFGLQKYVCSRILITCVIRVPPSILLSSQTRGQHCNYATLIAGPPSCLLIPKSNVGLTFRT